KQEQLARCFEPLLFGNNPHSSFQWRTLLDTTVDSQKSSAKLHVGTLSCSHVRPFGTSNARCNEAQEAAVRECLAANTPPIPGPICDAAPLTLSFEFGSVPNAQ